jgi:acylglycerol lipase
MAEEMIQGARGVELFLRSWRPETKPRGTVVIHHGFLSYSGMYEWPAAQLTRHGFAVYAHDMRGHGKSGGERYYVDRFSDYVADFARVVTLAKSREPDLPTFVLGHSVGGVVGCFYALESQSELAGFVCESFAHEVPAPDFALAMLRGISHVAPRAHVLKLKPEDFSRDPKVVEAMKNDPLIIHEPGPTQTLAEMARADDRLKKEFGKITLPVLILHGTADKATKPHGSQLFFDKTGSTDKTLKLYDGHFHDLLNDVDKERVMADVTEWLVGHVPR